MPVEVFMLQLSPTMTEGRIARWLKKEGDAVESGEVLAEVETDKATMELEAPEDGVLAKIVAPEGATVPVGALIAVMAEEGEELSDEEITEIIAAASEGAAAGTPATAEEQGAAAAQAAATPQPAGASGAEAGEEALPEAGPAGVFQADGDYDVAIIGAGPGGYVAAIRAAQLGLKVACIEAEHLGGICLNWGCIPTKALLRTAELVQAIREHGKEMGLGVAAPKPDLAAAIARSRKIADKLSRGIAYLFRKNKVEHIQGRARFAEGPRLVVDTADGEREVRAKHVVIATGARARVFPGMEVDGEVVITYKEALVRKKLPKHLIVIGSGAIGMEFAYFFRQMGAEVTILEAAEHVLPLEDEEIAKVVEKSFKKQGMEVITGARVVSARNESGKAVVVYEKNGEETRLEGDCCLVAVGVVPNTEDLGLEHTQVRLRENGTIAVDRFYRTDHPGIYAIGDVIGAPALAHVASHEGIVCVEAIAGENPHPVDYGNVPSCTYCQPQVGSCGKTERQCREEGIPIKVGRFPYAPNGKALGLGETEGMVKLIFHAETGELLGAHIVGAEATELIVTMQLARTLETTEAEIIHHMFPHPTLSEMLHEAAMDAFGRAIHI